MGVSLAVAALGAVAHLLVQLEGPDSAQRSAAVDSLAVVCAARPADLGEGLRISGWRGLEGLIDAAVAVGRGSVPLLMETARTHPKEDARRLAVRGLGRIGGEAAADSLIRLIHGPERDLAAQALGASGHKAAEPVLAELLTDEVPDVRRRAVVAIGSD